MQKEPPIERASRTDVVSFLGGLKSKPQEQPTGEQGPSPKASDPRSDGMPTLRQGLEAAADFDISPVLCRYREEYALTEAEAKEHEVELKRYLVLTSHSPCGYAVTPPVDYLWHTFIIFTRLYCDFGNKVVGHYIHHAPKELDPAEASGRVQSYGAFLVRYAEVFGHEAPEHIWPRISNQYAGASCSYSPPGCGNDG